MSPARREALATAWVGPLTFLVHLLGAQPQLIGVWCDDAIYMDLGRSLASGHGLAVDTLPLSPASAKYPVGWPLLLAGLFRLGLDGRTEAGGFVILAINAAFWALSAHLAANRLLPALGERGVGPRALVGLTLAINTVSLRVAITAMSEPMFTVALISAVILAFQSESSSRRAPLIGLGAAVALAGLARSVGAPLALVGAGLALLATRRARVPGAIVAGGAVVAGVGRLVRAAAPQPRGDAATILHYYTSYDEHVRYYGGPLGAGDLAGFVGRLTQVAGYNAGLAPRSLGSFLFPADLVGLPDSGAGVAMVGVVFFALACASLRRPAARPVLALILAYTAIFLCWTWPFSNRFWLPVFPLLAPLAVLGLGELGNIGRLIRGPLVALAVMGNAIVPLNLLLDRLSPGELTAAAPDEQDEDLALLRGRVGPEDVVLGSHVALWFGARVPSRAMELEALLPADDRLGLMLGAVDAEAEAPRLADALESGFAAMTRALPRGREAWVLQDAALDGAGGRRMRAATALLVGRGRLVLAGQRQSAALYRVVGR